MAAGAADIFNPFSVTSELLGSHLELRASNCCVSSFFTDTPDPIGIKSSFALMVADLKPAASCTPISGPDFTVKSESCPLVRALLPHPTAIALKINVVMKGVMKEVMKEVMNAGFDFIFILMFRFLF